MVEKEALEHFFNAKDEIRIVDKHLKIWIFFLLVFPVITTILYILEEIELWMTIVPWIVFVFVILFFLCIRLIHHEESKFYFKAGIEILVFSFLCFYISAVFSYTENYVAFIYYFSFWLIESILVIVGVLYNIKRDAYSQEAVFKDIPFHFNIFTAIILMTGIVFNFLPAIWAYFYTVGNKLFIFSRSGIGLAWPFNFVGLWTLFGWRLLLKGILLKKYTVLKKL